MKPHRRANATEKYDEFGQCITVDTFITRSPESISISGDKDALVIRDLGTDYLDCIPMQDKTMWSHRSALMQFLSNQDIARLEKVHSDRAGEIKSALDNLGIRHSRSQPYDPQSNGVAERTVRMILEGMRTLLLHAGLPPPYWRFAARAWCQSHNVSIDADGSSPYARRFDNGNWKGSQTWFSGRTKAIIT